MTEYAPYELTSDGFELVSTEVSGPVGTAIVHHRAHRGSPVATIFIHGAAGSWTTWSPLLRAARESGVELGELVLIDLPGWGGGRLLDPSPSLDAICDVVRDAALRLGYTEWAVVGHSMGGFLALHLAVTDPERVHSVTMVSGTTFSVIESVEHPLTRFRTLPGFVALWQVMKLLSRLGSGGRAFVGALARVGLLRPAVFPLFRHPWRVGRSVIDALGRELRPASFVAATDIVRNYDTSAWTAVTCPVTAIKGDRDVFVRDDDLDRLREVVSQARTIVVPDCGHFAAVERPFEVIEAMRPSGDE